MQKQIIIGNLGNDPEIRTMNGTDREVATFSLASNDRRKKSDPTTWFRVNAYGNNARTCFERLSKGDKVFVEGPLKASAYMKNGEPQYSLTIDATNVHFIQTKGKNASAPATAASAAPAATSDEQDASQPPF